MSDTEVRQNMKEAIEIVESVHGFPDSMRSVQFTTFTGPADHLGEYDMLTRSIDINTTNPELRSTLVHEIGHAIDHGAFEGSGLASAMPRTPQMRAWREAVWNSEAVRALKGEPEDQYTTYLRSLPEIWAHSYAQWVAVRSGDEQLLTELRSRLSSSEADQYRQWEDQDFEPIAEALDHIFQSEGWLK
ncbi:hypothetical protein [Actinorugispora endophytica]|uniref:hypothetical protein n=1 Tax=Actinorugispora endophytica TaxID=1605990 RepID=UPI00105B3389|nr:hypothetical protein [Actinorugispora endophytica]